MANAGWEDRSIDEMLEFIQQNLPSRSNLRDRDDHDADALLQAIQEMGASLARIERDIGELREKLGPAETR